MKSQIKSVAVLVSICAVIGLLLAATNAITAPVIEQNQNAAANAALLEVMPTGKNFDAVSLGDYELPLTVTEAYRETSGVGYVIKLTTAGYGTDMVIMCGVTMDGKVTGAVCLSSNETLGVEKTYGVNFTDKDAAGVEAVDTVAGATKTTAAYKGAVKDAVNAAIILSGGSVDIRTEEQILADNLSAALPAGEGKFTKLFVAEVITGVDAIYGADNGVGYVCKVGDQYVGMDANGALISGDVADATPIVSAVSAVTSTVYRDIDLAKYPALKDTVVSAKVTATGNYVLETKGAGYGIKGGNEYHPASGEYIVVRLSITPDGTIIDCLTVSQAETENLGDACAQERFYGQFDGKTKLDYTTVDGISGATMTTNGYMQAVQRAFDAVAVLEGGAR